MKMAASLWGRKYDFERRYFKNQLAHEDDALTNRTRGPYEEIFVLTFKAYGPNEVRSMHLECQNKYFPYGPKPREWYGKRKIVDDSILHPTKSARFEAFTKNSIQTKAEKLQKLVKGSTDVDHLAKSIKTRRNDLLMPLLTADGTMDREVFRIVLSAYSTIRTTSLKENLRDLSMTLYESKLFQKHIGRQLKLLMDEEKPTSEDSQTMFWLVGTMEMLASAIPESVFDLPLDQIQETVKFVRQKGIEITEDLDKKLETLKEKEKVFVKSKNEERHLGNKWKPPNNFRQMSLVPDINEIRSKPYLQEIIISGCYESADHYLDIQFRLFREDMVHHIRSGIKRVWKYGQYSSLWNQEKFRGVRIYYDVKIIRLTADRGKLMMETEFNVNHPSLRRVRWKRNKRLMPQSLLCFSSDGFQTLFFGTVAYRNADMLEKGRLIVCMEKSSQEVSDIIQIISGGNFTVIESEAYFEAYRHVLAALQTFNSEDPLPFEKYFTVQERLEAEHPKYFRLEHCVSFENITLPTCFITSQSHSAASLSNCRSSPTYEPISPASSPGSSMDSPAFRRHIATSSGYVSTSTDHILPSSSPKEALTNPSVPITLDQALTLDNWPPCSSLALDQSQRQALHCALFKELAIIQGPPGTGKTFIGIKIVKYLLNNKHLWQSDTPAPILLVTYTNHALDQFLEGIMNSDSASDRRDIVRVGGRCRNEQLQQFVFQNRHLSSESFYEKQGKLCQLLEGMAQTSFMLTAIRKPWDVLHDFGLEQFSEEFEMWTNLLLNQGSKPIASSDRRGGKNNAVKFWLTKDLDKIYDDLRNQHRGRRGMNYIQGETPQNDDGDDNIYNEYETEADVEAILAERDGWSGGEVWQYKDHVEESTREEEMICYVLQRVDPFTEEEARNLKKCITAEPKDRWKLFKLWIDRFIAYQANEITKKRNEYESSFKQDEETSQTITVRHLRKAKIVGMTTTGAAKNRSLINRVRPRIVIVEEAAEVLEAHVISSLTPSCQHLILIGDHQQLRPKPTVYHLEKKYNLGVSLFERMINNGMPCVRLNEQHRMRPEIAKLLEPIYDGLKNHESVLEYKSILGMEKNVYFIQHENKEEELTSSTSRSNQYEVDYLVGLCKYLLLQGYKESQITILTLYANQMFRIRDGLKMIEVKDVSAMVVDNYQGEENDIILLSLVRSNNEGKTGFAAIENRICVALSRAKQGFYCIGNFKMFESKSKLWRKIVSIATRECTIGEKLTVICQNHGNVTQIGRPEDFERLVTDGGCGEKCDYRLDCGHVCDKQCHTVSSEHTRNCRKPCDKPIRKCELNHVCPRKCGEHCPAFCSIKVTKKLPDCGHEQEMECHADPSRSACQERCERLLECGHQCQTRCGKKCTEKCQVIVKKNDWPCGHGASIACHAGPEHCKVECSAILDCGHKCQGTCGICKQGRVHASCDKKCSRVLPCGHQCEEKCKSHCPPCKKPCKVKCTHSKCKKKCGRSCAPCKEDCPWKCFHHECTNRCGELCNRPRCENRCDEKMKCGHQCQGLCSEECICVLCDLNGDQKITEIFFGTEDEPGARFYKLPDCNHIFEVIGLDQYMDMAETNENGQKDIKMKLCPMCKSPVSTALRQVTGDKEMVLIYSTPRLSAFDPQNPDTKFFFENNRFWHKLNKFFMYHDM